MSLNDDAGLNGGLSLVTAVERWADLEPTRHAISWRNDDYVTYGQLLEDVRAVAGGLAASGVQRNDTVLLMLPNCLEFVQCWLAISYLGAIEVPVNVHDRGRFLEHIVDDSRASVAIVHASLLHRFESILAGKLRSIVVVGAAGELPGAAGRASSLQPYESLLSAQAAAAAAPVERRDVAAIFYTSGTTGPAKGIMFTYGQAALCAANLSEVVGLTADDTYFVCMPLFHSNAQIIQVMPALIAGARTSLWPGFNAETWLDDVRGANATLTNTLGVMCQSIFDRPARASDPDNPLRVVQTIPLPQAIAEEFEARFAVQCVDGYGLTDVGIVSFRRRDEPLVPGSSGRPLRGYDVIIADPETDEPVATGTIGEILVRPTIPFAFMGGYWNNPTATVAAWRNLWFHTGDAGYLDEQGHLYFHERLKDAIRVRGENVSSAQVEAEFLLHPAVEECAAIAVPSERGDDDIKLCVVLRQGHDVSPSELLDSCAANMPYFAVPRYIEFLAELPKTATGKIRKVELRQEPADADVWDRKAAGYLVAR